MKPQPRYKPGDRIANRYLVHQALMGGMGEVYLCLDLETNYPYALKTFQQRYLTDPQRLRRAFEQEVATWVALEKHPNIVRCHWMQLLDHQPFVCLEWIAGEEGRGTDLRGWLRRGPLDLKLALEITMDICHGLLHAQTKRPGLVHRDLKPENILMTQGGLAKLTDFGLAEIAQAAGLAFDNGDVTSNGRQSLVGGHGITGTPIYMAPEQWRGEPLDAYTDIYAIGVILYELLTGRPPFAAALPSTTPQSVQSWLRALQHAHEQAPVMSLPGGLPAGLNDLLQRCLAKTPTARHAHVADLLRHVGALYQAHFDQPPPSRPNAATFTATDHNNRSATYYALGQWDAALADCNHAITLDPADATAYSNRGVTYTALGQRDAALVDHNHAILLDPAFATAYNNRGNTYAALGQRDAALVDHNHAILLDPAFATAYNNRGATYAALGQRDAALADYTKAILLDPAYAIAYYNRGVTYTDLGQRDAALADFTQAITLDPHDAKTYYNRGNTYNTLGQQDAALADFTHTIALDPALVQAYSNRGLIYADWGQHKPALADYNQAITLDPADATAYYNRGVTYTDLGQRDAALADFTQAITLDPAFAQAYYNRGVTYVELGQQEAALADFTQAITLDPHDAKTYYNRGATYVELGQQEAALADYTHAITLDPAFAQAYLGIGRLLGNQGQFAKALPYFEKVAEFGDPQGAQYAAQVRQMLGTQPQPQTTPASSAFEAFQQADSLPTMQQAVTRFPFLLHPDFIATIEQVIAQQVPSEHRPTFTQRLAWLRQIANTQHPRSIP